MMSRKSQQTTLHGFLSKKNETVLEGELSNFTTVNFESDGNNATNNDTEEESVSSTMVTVNDIGHYISTGERPDDDTLYQLLTNHWKPPNGFQFPFSNHLKGGKNERRYLNRAHLERFPWTVLSLHAKGLFCLYCPFFSPGTDAIQRQVQPEKLVKKPLTVFAKLLGKHGDLQLHGESYYHVAAVERAKLFISVHQDPSLQINNRLNQDRLRVITENRKKLEGILSALIFLGRQNIPLRGHRDNGNIEVSSEHPDAESNNEGNFRELLKLLAERGDEVLKKHLETSAGNAKYTSNTIQNDLIQCLGSKLQDAILDRIRSSGVYSVMFDETTDLSHTNIMCFLVRYVDASNGIPVIREDFLDFFNTHEFLADQNSRAEGSPNEELVLSGQNLGTLVLERMAHFGLDPQSCVGVGTDGCSVMTSEAKGAIKKIQEKAVYAERCHCYNHDLNLSLGKASKIPEVRNTMHTIQEVVSFFTASPKRNEVLVRVVGCQLKGLCRTRWVENYQAVLRFVDKYAEIIEALEDIEKWNDRDTASKAASLISAIATFQFIIVLYILQDLFSATVPVSAALQTRNLDVPAANELMRNTMKILEGKRAKAESLFAEIFTCSSKIASDLHVDQTVPRRAKKQVHRSNHETSSSEQFYRVSIFIPLLDEVLQDLSNRFKTDEAGIVKRLTQLLPRAAGNLKSKELEEIVDSLYSKYRELMTSGKKLFYNEMLLWHQKWKNKEGASTDVMTALDAADRDVYPTIHILLKILAVLPVSVASAERSFSTLSRLKTHLRTTMSENRLTALALQHTHRDAKVDIDSVIDLFGSKKGRRVNFIS